MSDNDSVPDRGDSPLAPGLRRRRTFIATPLPAEFSGPPQTPPEEDIPVLTEIVGPETAPAENAVSEAPRERFDEALVSILAADLAHSIELRLGVEIPSLIEATLDSLEQDLRRGIVAATEAALKDFLARRQQLRLPLDEPQLGD